MQLFSVLPYIKYVLYFSPGSEKTIPSECVRCVQLKLKVMVMSFSRIFFNPSVHYSSGVETIVSAKKREEHGSFAFNILHPGIIPLWMFGFVALQSKPRCFSRFEFMLINKAVQAVSASTGKYFRFSFFCKKLNCIINLQSWTF